MSCDAGIIGLSTTDRSLTELSSDRHLPALKKSGKGRPCPSNCNRYTASADSLSNMPIFYRRVRPVSGGVFKLKRREGEFKSSLMMEDVAEFGMGQVQ